MAKRIYKRIPPEERVMSSLCEDLTTGCLNFTGPIRPDGYGQVHGWDGDRPIRLRAHRIAWEFVHRATLLDPNIYVCHCCDNRRCCNVDHLFLGTQEDNIQDMIRKGRGRYMGAPGERNAKAKLTATEVIQIFYADGRQSDIGDRFGVDQRTVSAIKTGVIWTHITGAPKVGAKHKPNTLL